MKNKNFKSLRILFPGYLRKSPTLPAFILPLITNIDTSASQSPFAAGWGGLYEVCQADLSPQLLRSLHRRQPSRASAYHEQVKIKLLFHFAKIYIYFLVLR